jgi:hypothetical protein
MPDDVENSAPHLTGDLDRRARAGANWTCRYCKGESRNDHDLCEVCGAPRATSDHMGRAPEPREDLHLGARPEPVKASEKPVQPMVDTVTPVVMPVPPRDPFVRLDTPEAPDDDMEAMQSRWVSRFDPEVALKLLGAVVGTGLFVLLMVWLFTPNATTARVASMNWSRDRTLQERHDYNGEGWRDQAPPMVFSWDHCETRQRGTERCHPHDCNCHDVSYECNCTGGDSYDCRCHNVCRRSCSSNRNGSATCSEDCNRECDTCTNPRRCQSCSRRECDTCYDQCPVYAEWCQYRYHQWDDMQHLRTAGSGRDGVVWPDLEARGPLQRVMEAEEYRVRFTDTKSDRVWNRTYSFAQYERFDVGQMWDVEWTRAGTFTLKILIPR